MGQVYLKKSAALRKIWLSKVLLSCKNCKFSSNQNLLYILVVIHLMVLVQMFLRLLFEQRCKKMLLTVTIIPRVNNYNQNPIFSARSVSHFTFKTRTHWQQIFTPISGSSSKLTKPHKTVTESNLCFLIVHDNVSCQICWWWWLAG